MKVYQSEVTTVVVAMSMDLEVPGRSATEWRSQRGLCSEQVSSASVSYSGARTTLSCRTFSSVTAQLELQARKPSTCVTTDTAYVTI
jgi:hypothetical protein